MDERSDGVVVERVMVCPMDDVKITGATLAKIAGALRDWRVCFDDRGGIGFEKFEQSR